MIAPLVAICMTSSLHRNSGTSSIGDRSAAIGVFTEEHASVAQPRGNRLHTKGTTPVARADEVIE